MIEILVGTFFPENCVVTFGSFGRLFQQGLWKLLYSSPKVSPKESVEEAAENWVSDKISVEKFTVDLLKLQSTCSFEHFAFRHLIERCFNIVIFLQKLEQANFRILQKFMHRLLKGGFYVFKGKFHEFCLRKTWISNYFRTLIEIIRCFGWNIPIGFSISHFTCPEEFFKIFVQKSKGFQI